MIFLLAFALLLLLATLISESAKRSVLSLSVLFLLGGILAGNTGFFAPKPTDAFVAHLTEFALFSVLFTDGMRLSFRELSRPGNWPGRALILGLPVTLLVMALIAHWLLDLTWLQAFLLGAVLSPTDPVLVSAVLGHRGIPDSLKHLLQVESGLNDGLALPIVFVLLHWLAQEPGAISSLALEVVSGLVIGAGVAWAAFRLNRWSAFDVSEQYQPLFVTAVGLTILSLSSTLHANEFLAAYAAGLTLTTLSDHHRRAFAPFGEVLSELLKLSGLFVFGTLLRPEFMASSWVLASAFAALMLVIPRTIGLAVAMPQSGISSPEFWTAAWLGPRGFASILYSLYVLQAGVAKAETVFYFAAAVIVASIVLHSSTDVLVVRWFRSHQPAEQKST